MTTFDKIRPPATGSAITVDGGHLRVPNHPIVPFIRGDGTGPDIWAASEAVMDGAVSRADCGHPSIPLFEVYAGGASGREYGDNIWLPEDTLKAIAEFKVAIKGPLTTPVGGGIRSLNVGLRQHLDLYACVRPVRWFTGVPAPVKEPEKLDVVIFRENTEDVYSGIEVKEGTPEAKKLIDFVKTELGKTIRPDSGVGIKPISRFGTERLVRRAIQYALEQGRKVVTIVHKGNIMKFTEGAFKDWGYALAIREFRDAIVTEDEVWNAHGGKVPAGKLLVNDRIADAMFQQLLLRPDEYDVIATCNLNGDYLSDACAAQVGGLGLAPGANIGDAAALFEATHGTAPKYAGLDKVNPSSVILSGVMMLQHMGWNEAADLIMKGIERSIGKKEVTYDLERQMQGAHLLKCSEFGQAVLRNMA